MDACSGTLPTARDAFHLASIATGSKMVMTFHEQLPRAFRNCIVPRADVA
jgi:hypothetical protein